MSQTYSNWECIVVDDGSTDDSLDVLNQIAASDSRIKVFQRPPSLPKGANSCRNFGFKQSSGQLINWLDSDDLMSSDKIGLQIEKLRLSGTPNQVVLTANWSRFRHKDTLVEPSRNELIRDFDSGLDLLFAFNKDQMFLPIHAYLIERSLIGKVGGWNPEVKVNQDGEFITRVLLKSGKVLGVEKAYVYYRLGDDGNVSSLNSKYKIEQSIRTQKMISSHIRQYTSRTPDVLQLSQAYLFDTISNNWIRLKHAWYFRTVITKKLFG